MTTTTTFNRLLFGPAPPRARRPVPSERLRRAFAEADRAAIYLVARVKFYAMIAVSIYLVLQFLNPWVLYWVGLAAAIGIGGVIHYWLEAAHRCPWYRYAFAVYDIVILTVALVVPNPGVFDVTVPAQTTLRFNSGTYYFVFIALAGLTYSPRYVLWVGGVSAAALAAAAVYYVLLPDTVTVLDLPNYLTATPEEKFALSQQPTFVSVANIIQDIVMVLLVTVIGAIAVWRTNGLIGRQLTAERERANLSRYFSPNLVDELADMDRPLGVGRRQNAAILFADLVGFTSLAEKLSPDATMDLLRSFHGRMARQIFAHNGTVDKYIGDAVMATFGMPAEGPRDAINALACAAAMLHDLEAWNAERRAAGAPELRIGIGVHCGPVVVGDIGDERRLEFAVLGDTVNVASRVEGLTRTVAQPLLVSNALADQARREAGPDDTPLVARLVPVGAAVVRGRSSETEIWTLNPQPTKTP